MSRMQANFSEADLALVLRSLERDAGDPVISPLLEDLRGKAAEISGTGREAELFFDATSWLDVAASIDRAAEFGAAEMTESDRGRLRVLSLGLDEGFAMHTGIGLRTDEPDF